MEEEEEEEEEEEVEGIGESIKTCDKVGSPDSSRFYRVLLGFTGFLSSPVEGIGHAVKVTVFFLLRSLLCWFHTNKDATSFGDAGRSA